MDAELKVVACESIDNLTGKLHEISQEIWNHPELAYKEVRAHDLITKFLTEQPGWSVQPSYKIPTAFRADFGSAVGPHICVICEYDALPEIGHACGHNLIAEVGIAAGIGIKSALETEHGKTSGKVTILGTPAEEGGGGKCVMIGKSAFSDYDVAMMSHPSPLDIRVHLALALQSVTVRYHGKAAHAAGFPWEGVNALDAAVMCYQAISCMRQQLKPSWRVHGIITNGGAKPNIIPEVAELYFYLRAPLEPELQILKQKAVTCFEGAASATGCSVQIVWEENPYSNLITNKTMAKLYEANAVSLGIEFLTDENSRTPMGSTDMGNVSHILPSIHPEFYVGTSDGIHTRGFAKTAGSPEAQPYAIRQAKILAMTAIDIMTEPGILDTIKQDFKNDLEQENNFQ